MFGQKLYVGIEGFQATAFGFRGLRPRGVGFRGLGFRGVRLVQGLKV